MIYLIIYLYKLDQKKLNKHMDKIETFHLWKDIEEGIKRLVNNIFLIIINIMQASCHNMNNVCINIVFFIFKYHKTTSNIELIL